MEMNKELLAKAKSAKSPEELIGIAKENGMELTEESAKAYFELLSPKTGEIADEELENVAGGGCYKNGELVVSPFMSCNFFESKNSLESLGFRCCPGCKYCKYKKGLYICTWVE